MYHSKKVILCLFYASEQVKVLKKATGCHGRSIFTHIQVGGLGGSGGWGKAAKQGENPFTAKMRPFICQLSASQTSEHFLP